MRGLASEQWMREDVRVGEVRFAVVGYFVCEAEAEGYWNWLGHGPTLAPSSEGRTGAA